MPAMFLDDVRIVVRAGAGGDGASTFRREAHVPRGGPDGGDGGRGGSVYLRVDAGQTTLHDFRFKHHFTATPGGRGERSKRHGKAGEDLHLAVPPGTAVIDIASGELIADLVAVGQEAMVARGGRGGLGNVHFATATHQAPKHAQKGEPGEEHELRLELRLIADIGLVGLPNAGKSTLLAALTAATPKIAAYPFTTLEPNLGVMDLGLDDGRRPTIADVPGLIEGASDGAGLGHAFLRHVERTRILLHIVDGSSRDPRLGPRRHPGRARGARPGAARQADAGRVQQDGPGGRRARPGRRSRSALRRARRAGAGDLGRHGRGAGRAARGHRGPAAGRRRARRAARSRGRGDPPARGRRRRVRRSSARTRRSASAASASSAWSTQTNFENEESAERFQRELARNGVDGGAAQGRRPARRHGPDRRRRAGVGAARGRPVIEDEAVVRPPAPVVPGLGRDPRRHVRPDPPRPPRASPRRRARRSAWSACCWCRPPRRPTSRTARSPPRRTGSRWWSWRSPATRPSR